MTSSAQHVEFFQLATKLGFLTAAQYATLSLETTADSTPPAAVALQAGVLSPAEVEIVETLLRPKEIAPGYEILSLIGYGGMGVVYRAQQIALARPVALKTILLNQLGKGNSTRRFEQEAVMIGRLVHPNIVAAYDFGRHAGRLFLAMELVEGEDVETWLNAQARVEEATAWWLARQAAAGLAHAASQGMVHRDIKPANLLLVPAPAGSSLPAGVPQVKIADFGLAYFREQDIEQTRLTTQGSALGSPNYMPPEQIEAAAVDQRSDIYALGATVFHILAGFAPWHDLNLSQIITKKLSSQAPLLSAVREDVSPATTQLVADMLAREPAQRPADYEQLLQRIDGILATLQPSAVPVKMSVARTSDPQLRTIAYRRPQLGRRTLLGLSAALLIPGGLGLWWQWQPATPIARDCLPVGPPVSLFNGKSLPPPSWQLLAGQWSPETTLEDGFVLAGSDQSLIARHLRELNPAQLNYRLQMTINLHDATTAEVQFDVAEEPAGKHWCVRLHANQLQMIRLTAERAEETVFEHTFTAKAAASHTLTLERHTQGWWLLFDEQPLTSVPGLHVQPRTEFRLHATGGVAYFFDFSLTPLAPPAS